MRLAPSCQHACRFKGSKGAAPSVTATGHVLQMLPLLERLGLKCGTCQKATGSAVASTFASYSRPSGKLTTVGGDASAILATAEYTIGLVASGHGAPSAPEHA